MKKQDWFSTWFDTSYYHILYQHRSFDEAERFIANLLNFLSPDPNSSILDLACGKGRHSYFIAQKNFKVTGVDLSVESIEWAKENYALPNLNFDVHDMRKVYSETTFDYIFNFFTSFGYFENDDENLQVLKAIAKGLKADGTLVIDFMNAEKAIEELKEVEQLEIDGIFFNITRTHEDGFIIKTIKFEDKGEKHEYYERVQALTLPDFEKLLKLAGLNLVTSFGDYDLQAYNEKVSNRLIMVLTKNA